VPSGGRPVKPRGRPAGWSGLHQLSPPPWPLLLVQTRVLKATGQTNIKHGRPAKEIGRPAFGPFRVGVWPTRSMCQIHPRGDQDFDIWSTLLCHPLKYSNLVPKLLKSNKHYYSSWNYVSRQGEYMVILYIYST
jgi:hypothetical protein